MTLAASQQYALDALSDLQSEFKDRHDYKEALEEVIILFQSSLDAANEEDLPPSDESEDEEIDTEDIVGEILHDQDSDTDTGTGTDSDDTDVVNIERDAEKD